MIEIISTIVIACVVIALLVKDYFKDREHNNQINRLIKAVVSKTPQDLVNLTLAEKTRVEMENKPPLGDLQDEFTQLGTSNPELFDRMIDDQLKSDDGQSGEDGTAYES